MTGFGYWIRAIRFYGDISQLDDLFHVSFLIGFRKLEVGRDPSLYLVEVL